MYVKLEDGFAYYIKLEDKFVKYAKLRMGLPSMLSWRISRNRNLTLICKKVWLCEGWCGYVQKGMAM